MSLRTRLLLAAPMILLLLLTRDLAVGQNAMRNLSGDSDTSERILPRRNTIYETNYGSNTIEVFSLKGSDLGVFAMPAYPTGLTFDNAGNLYVSSDDPAGYSIEKFTPDGSVSVFANNGLNAPHALAFDKAGNLYVANAGDNTIEKFTPDGSVSVFANSGLNAPHALAFDKAGILYVANAGDNTIEKFTPDGVGTEFANYDDGLRKPLDLAFDIEGNLYVSNAYGGPTQTGSVEKFTPDGVGSVFADSGFHLAYGLAIDSAGNLYVSNFRSNTIEKFSPTGIDLGVFASAGLDLPHGMIFDRAGYLYVANNGNHTIEKFSSAGTDLGVFARTGSGPHFLALGVLRSRQYQEVTAQVGLISEVTLSWGNQIWVDIQSGRKRDQ